MSDPTTATPYSASYLYPSGQGDLVTIKQADASFRTVQLTNRTFTLHDLSAILNDAYQAGARDMRDHLDPLGPLDADGRRRGPAIEWDGLRPQDQAAIKHAHHDWTSLSMEEIRRSQWRYVWGGGKPGYWEAVT